MFESEPFPPGCFSRASHIRGQRSGVRHLAGTPAIEQARANAEIAAHKHSQSPPLILYNIIQKIYKLNIFVKSIFPKILPLEQVHADCLQSS